MHEEVEASLSETLELHRVGSMIQVLEYEQAQRERFVGTVETQERKVVCRGGKDLLPQCRRRMCG